MKFKSAYKDLIDGECYSVQDDSRQNYNLFIKGQKDALWYINRINETDEHTNRACKGGSFDGKTESWYRLATPLETIWLRASYEAQKAISLKDALSSSVSFSMYFEIKE